jgi:hypothetical protein
MTQKVTGHLIRQTSQIMLNYQVTVIRKLKLSDQIRESVGIELDRLLLVLTAVFIVPGKLINIGVGFEVANEGCSGILPVQLRINDVGVDPGRFGHIGNCLHEKPRPEGPIHTISDEELLNAIKKRLGMMIVLLPLGQSGMLSHL